MVVTYNTRVQAVTQYFPLVDGTANWVTMPVIQGDLPSSYYNPDWTYCTTISINYNDYTSSVVYVTMYVPNGSTIICEDCYIWDYGTNNSFAVKLTCTKDAKVYVFTGGDNGVINIDDVNNYVTHYSDSEFGHISNIDTSLGQTNSYLVNANSTLTQLRSTTSNIYSSVDNVESQLATMINYLNQLVRKTNNIEWITYTPRSYSASTDNTNYSNDDITSNVKDIYVKFSPTLQDGNYIYRIDTGVSSNNYLASMNVVEVVGITNTQYITFSPKYYLDRSGRNIVIYVYDTLLNGNNDTREIIMHFNGGAYYLRYRNDMFNIKMLPDTNENYWRMIGVFEQNDINIDLGDVTVSVTPEVPYTQEDVNEVINNIDLSNEIHTDINTVVSPYINMFDNYNDQIDLDDLTPSMPIQLEYASFWRDVTAVIDGVPNLRAIITFCYVGAILILLLGG